MESSQERYLVLILSLHTNAETLAGASSLLTCDTGCGPHTYWVTIIEILIHKLDMPETSLY